MKHKHIYYLIFFSALLFFPSYAFKELNSSPQSTMFFSFLKVFEFFKNAHPSSNKIMNFHHYETENRNINFLQTRDNSSNETTNNSESNQTAEEKLTVEDIQKIIHEENQGLKKEFEKHEDELSQNIDNLSKKVTKNINDAEDEINEKIDKSSDILEKRLDRIEEKVDENIRQTEESSIIIISQQIQEKEHDLEILEKEIEELKEVATNEGEITNICNLYTSCSDCTINAHCGWCLLEQKCVPGDNVGPFESQCNFYNFHYCSTLSCARNTDCYSCLADPNCGWCQDSSRGIEVCLEEEANFQECPFEGWFHSQGENSQCKKNDKIYEKITDEEKKERESMNTLKKTDENEMELEKKKEQLHEKEIMAKNLKDEIAIMEDELETVKKRLKIEKEKEEIQDQQNHRTEKEEKQQETPNSGEKNASSKNDQENNENLSGDQDNIKNETNNSSKEKNNETHENNKTESNNNTDAKEGNATNAQNTTNGTNTSKQENTANETQSQNNQTINDTDTQNSSNNSTTSNATFLDVSEDFFADSGKYFDEFSFPNESLLEKRSKTKSIWKKKQQNRKKHLRRSIFKGENPNQLLKKNK